ncbi:hypothetical protein R5R35_008061 [Gryllus longicercus]|uniref:Uncharacterized protein n=1 Tax=Gryllus longicercus TaxID=2509291 RepID=A0AAN9W6G1_9ORTH
MAERFMEARDLMGVDPERRGSEHDVEKRDREAGPRPCEEGAPTEPSRMLTYPATSPCLQDVESPLKQKQEQNQAFAAQFQKVKEEIQQNVQQVQENFKQDIQLVKQEIRQNVPALAADLTSKINAVND